MKNIAVLGSTGSVGKQTMEVLSENKEHFRVTALAANRQVDVLLEQIEKFAPEVVAVYDKESAEILQSRVKGATRIVCGMEGLCKVAAYQKNDLVVCAIAGSVGLCRSGQLYRRAKTLPLPTKRLWWRQGRLSMQWLRKKERALFL